MVWQTKIAMIVFNCMKYKACQNFYQEIYNLLEIYIRRYSDRRVWFTSSITKAIKTKSYLWKQYKKFKLPIYLERVNNLRKLIQREIKQEYRTFIASVEDVSKTPP